MNETVLGFQINEFLKAFKAAPLTPIVAHVVSAQGNTVTLDTPLPSINVLRASVLTFTSGQFGKMAVGIPIVAATQTSVLLSSRLGQAVLPQPGDAVRIDKGPMGSASVYIGYSDNASADDQYRVSVTTPDRMVATTEIGDEITNWTRANKGFQMEVVVEAPINPPTVTQAGSRSAINELSLLSEQVMLLMWLFRHNSGNGIIDQSDMACRKGFTQRTGSDPRRAAEISFEWTVK